MWSFADNFNSFKLTKRFCTVEWWINNFNKELNIKIFTDYGCFVSINKPSFFNSFKHQQISLFTENKYLKINTYGLKYNIIDNTISSLFSGTLNESSGKRFFIDITDGDLIVYLKYNWPLRTF